MAPTLSVVVVGGMVVGATVVGATVVGVTVVLASAVVAVVVVAAAVGVELLVGTAVEALVVELVVGRDGLLDAAGRLDVPHAVAPTRRTPSNHAGRLTARRGGSRRATDRTGSTMTPSWPSVSAAAVTWSLSLMPGGSRRRPRS
jgi:hypothetical protein